MKILMFITLTLALILGACAPLQPVSSAGEQPAPMIEMDPVTEATHEPASISADVPATIGYQSVNVVDVAVEVGTGSPIPVFVDIGADLPDQCAQVEFVEVIHDKTVFNIYVGTIPSTDEACFSAVGTIPFRMKIPLNVVGLPAGSYSVQVNSVSADFQLDVESSATELHTREMPVVKQDIQVDDVSIEVGVGSPRPVKAVVSANLPNACAQLGEIQMHRDGTQYFVRLIAYVPAQTDCNPDTLPMRIEIPLNTIDLPNGMYEVLVNGATTTFEMPLK
jgi:hypothetical protein